MATELKMCDPAYCSNCIYICEGDFICDAIEDEDGTPIMVVSDWTPTDDYGRCNWDPPT